MKKLLLSIFIVSSFAANAQVTVFEDSFETYPDFAITGFGNWLTLDLDGLNTYIGGYDVPDPDNDDWSATWPNAGAAQAYMIFNPSTATGVLNPDTTATPTGITNNSGTPEHRNFDPHTGAKYAACWNSAGTNPVNNDFLISPVLNLGPSNNELTVWTKSMSDSYDPETYRIMYYVGTGIPTALANFTQIYPALGNASAPYPNWGLQTVALNAYSNQQIRIGIRCTSADHYMFMVDDFKVTSSALGVNDVLSSKFSVYPNPSNGIINLTNSESIQVSQIEITDLNGRIVKTVNTADTFNDIQINVSDLSSGVYMMNINSDQGKAVKKIVKN